MIHKMNLAPSPFKAIAAGQKTVEMRLCDERRVNISVGDEIEFENIETIQLIRCKVVGLAHFRDFFELYSHYNKAVLGYNEDDIANPEDMYQYYSPEKIAQNGVLAIEIKLL